jgi:hypothetical protein
MLSNADLWLIVLMKKREIGFEDIKKAIDNIDDSIEDIFEISLPRTARKKFSYDEKRKHSLFHLILEDLDSLCRRGYVLRTYVSGKNTSEIVEKFQITPKGELRVAKLVVTQS